MSEFATMYDAFPFPTYNALPIINFGFILATYLYKKPYLVPLIFSTNVGRSILFCPMFKQYKGQTKLKRFFQVDIKVIYTKYSKHSNETNTFMGLGRAGRLGQGSIFFLFSGYHIRVQLLRFWMLRVELLFSQIIKVNSSLGKNSCETSSYDKPFPKYRKFFPSGNFLHWIIFIPKYKFFLGTNSFIGETGLFFPNFKVFLLLNTKI
mgnify:CR=1 FL=1